MAAYCFIFKWHLIVTFALAGAEAGLIVNKIQSFAKNPVIATDNINERYVLKHILCIIMDSGERVFL